MGNIEGQRLQTDEGLQGNEKIEAAIKALQQNPSEELLAHALTVVRRRMRDKGQLIVAVDAPQADGQMRLQAIKTDDGSVWWSAFTSFEEEVRGSNSVMSTFLADIEQLFHMAINEEHINGIILNPWNATLMLDKRLIRIVLGEVMGEKLEIVQATEADTEEILRLYKAQLGQEFCAWDEHYPERQDIAYDLSRDALFVMKNEAGEIVAAISIDEDENVENLPCWTAELQPGGEVARLAVRKDYQNQGIAREMIQYAMSVLKERGRKSIHYLVNRDNQKAVRSYAHLHFSQVGSCELYEQPFLCFEQRL